MTSIPSLFTKRGAMRSIECVAVAMHHHQLPPDTAQPRVSLPYEYISWSVHRGKSRWLVNVWLRRGFSVMSMSILTVFEVTSFLKN
jgi:hypothetical protein